MLRQAIRRLLWLVPTLIGITLASFVLVSYVPGPADDPAVLAVLGEERAVELRRSRFLDLPRFFNGRPMDMQERAREAMARLQADDMKAESARRTLLQLGGAALPFLLPQLDALEPKSRTRVALALSPIAERMGLRAEPTSDPEQAVAFWSRFWADRAVDFRPANARRAVGRLAQHGTVTRRADVLELDTYALDPIMHALEDLLPELRSTAGAANIGSAHRLLDVANHVTGRHDGLDSMASAQDAILCIRRWQGWWLIHEPDYTAYDGASRLMATLTETQYAKWAKWVALLGFAGTGAEAPVGQLLLDRAPTTLCLTLGSMGLAYGTAVLLCLLSVLRRQRRLDRWIFCATIAAYAIPTACLAALWRTPIGNGWRMPAAITTLACGLIASPLAQQRLSIREAAEQDYARHAAAYGLSPWRIAWRHALRNALLPAVTLFSVDLPVAIGGAFVVETAFGIPGLGEQTVRAVQANDVAWLVGLAFVTALAVATATILSDIAIAVLDPRLSLAALRHRRIGL